VFVNRSFSSSRRTSKAPKFNTSNDYQDLSY
jgi:hypothetical protein